jgi:hypothetical protein
MPKILGAGAVLTFMLALAACSGGGGQPAAGFFRQVETEVFGRPVSG